MNLKKTIVAAACLQTKHQEIIKQLDKLGSSCSIWERLLWMTRLYFTDLRLNMVLHRIQRFLDSEKKEGEE